MYTLFSANIHITNLCSIHTFATTVLKWVSVDSTNKIYWNNQPYIGFGPAAASYNKGVRSSNIPNLQNYIETLQNHNLPPADSEKIEGKLHIAETLMLNLRLLNGINIADFKKRFGEAPDGIFPITYEKYTKIGALKTLNGKLFIENQWLFVADSILADFLSEAG